MHNKFEKSRILGARALQLSMGAPFLIELSKEDLEKIRFNPIEIAKMEYEKGVLKIDVLRVRPHERLKKEDTRDKLFKQESIIEEDPNTT